MNADPAVLDLSVLTTLQMCSLAILAIIVLQVFTSTKLQLLTILVWPENQPSVL